MPDATTTLANIGEWSLPIFDEFKDFLWPIIGIGLVMLIVGVAIKIFR